MKKVLSLLLAMAMVFSLVACGGGNSSSDTGQADSGQKQEEKQEPMTDAEIAAMYSNPDDYKGRYIELGGQVFQAPEYDEDAVYLQMWQDCVNYDNNTIIKFEDPSFKVNDGDYIKLTGIVYGVYEGQNAFGADLTLPAILADTIEISTYKDVVAPAIYTITPSDATVDQLGYSITIEKVEIAETETRLYVKVENNGSGTFSVYEFNTNIIQNSKQYDCQSNYTAGYPEVQSDLRTGVVSEGVFCFPPIENAEFQVIMEAYSDNWEEELEDFVFDIAP